MGEVVGHGAAAGWHEVRFGTGQLIKCRRSELTRLEAALRTLVKIVEIGRHAFEHATLQEALDRVFDAVHIIRDNFVD